MLCDVLTGCQTLDQAAVEFSPGGIVDIPDVCIWLVESGITNQTLKDNKPIEYVAMALSGEMQAYCDIEDDMVKGMFGTIVQGYLKNGYNRVTAEMMAREFFRYES